jgi:hypothetical protein
MASMDDTRYTALPLPDPPAARLLEVKERLQGEALRFPLERWLVTDSLAVGRWLAHDDRYAHAHTTSWGCWWRGRPYGAYRVHRPDGSLRNYRLDVVEAVRIAPDSVRYRDLLLDAWILPSGEVRLEDEDEVETAVASGMLSAAQYRRIGWTRALFERRPDELTRRIDAAIAQAVQHVRDGRA